MIKLSAEINNLETKTGQHKETIKERVVLRKYVLGDQNTVGNGGPGVFWVGKSRIWDDCHGSQSPVYPDATGALLGVESWGLRSVLPLSASMHGGWGRDG